MDRKRTTKSQPASMDAIRILERDHRKVEQLLERYRTRRDSDSKRALVAAVTEELSRHMAAEENELYPVLRDAIDDGKSLMRDAVREHEEARGLLAELAADSSGGFDVDAKVATLRQAIAHHVRDEEQEIFPKMRDALAPERIRMIGARIIRAKRSAPAKPAPAAARKSPGATVRGVVSAAADRVTSLLSPPPATQKSRPKSRPKRPARKLTTAKRPRAGGGRIAKHK